VPFFASCFSLNTFGHSVAWRPTIGFPFDQRGARKPQKIASVFAIGKVLALSWSTLACTVEALWSLYQTVRQPVAATFRGAMHEHKHASHSFESLRSLGRHAHPGTTAVACCAAVLLCRFSISKDWQIYKTRVV
jgi:hypothetical protein